MSQEAEVRGDSSSLQTGAAGLCCFPPPGTDSSQASAARATIRLLRQPSGMYGVIFFLNVNFGDCSCQGLTGKHESAEASHKPSPVPPSDPDMGAFAQTHTP